MLWSSALSLDSHLDAAVSEVTQGVKARIPAIEIDLAVVFLSRHFDKQSGEVPALLRAAFPRSHILGCSAGGVIGDGREIEEQPAVSLTIAQLPDVQINPLQIRAEQLPDADASPHAWSSLLGVSPEPSPHFILLADPYSLPVTPLLAGLDYAYPRSVKLGGLASGAVRPLENALYLDDQILRTGLVGVALQGNIGVDTIVAQGCRPIGQPLRVTQAEDHVLIQLDGKPSLDVVRDVLRQASEEDRRLASQALLLGIASDNLTDAPRAGDFLIRNIMGADSESGAIAVGEILRRGQLVQFHVRDARTSAEDLELLMARYARGSGARSACGALLFSCLGRGRHLYGHPDHDTGIFKECIPGVPLGGFFCNGEIGPVSGATHLHGYTSSFGIFSPARP